MNFEEFKRQYQKVPVEEYPNRVLESVPDPVVSVQITTYQHADYIRDAIESVLMQETEFPVEILIGDDESTDGTREICKEYADLYPEKIRLMLHRRENNRELHGRPTHLFQYWYNKFCLRGRYIASVSGDDYWKDPQKIQKQFEELERKKECVLVYHHWIEKREHKAPAKSTQKRNEDVKKWPHALTLMYKNIFDEIPKISMELINEDALVKYMLMTKGEFEKLKEIDTAVYRKHDDSLYGSRGKIQQSYESCMSRFKILEYIEDENVKSKIIQDIKFFFAIILNSAASNKEIISNSKKIYDILSCASNKKVFFEIVIDGKVWQFLRIRAGLAWRNVCKQKINQ